MFVSYVSFLMFVSYVSLLMFVSYASLLMLVSYVSLLMFIFMSASYVGSNYIIFYKSPIKKKYSKSAKTLQVKKSQKTPPDCFINCSSSGFSNEAHIKAQKIKKHDLKKTMQELFTASIIPPCRKIVFPKASSQPLSSFMPSFAIKI